MRRRDYADLFARITARGADARVHWASGPRAGQSDPWDGRDDTLPGTPSRRYAGSRETPDGVCFAEALMGRPHLLILGAGHIGAAVAALGGPIGFRVTVVDPRPEFADAARLPGADEVVCAPYDEALATLPPYANTYVVIVTSGHVLDRQCAALCLARPHEYLGMIGSRAKVATVRTALERAGLDRAKIDAMHAPIGLPLGGREPAEIAIAICAELIQVRAARAARAFDPDVQAAIEDLARDLAAAETSGSVETSGAADTPAAGRPATLVTVIGHGGSVPRGAGARMLVGVDGVLAGSIGGGAVEAAAVATARTMARASASGPVSTSGTDGAGPQVDLVEYDLSDREGADLGMICGGRVRVLFETL